MLVINDKAGTINPNLLNSIDAFLEYADRDNVYIFANSLGTMDVNTSGAHLICVDYNKEIYTYQLNSNIYCIFFLKDGDNWYYSPKVYTANLYDLTVTRGNDTSDRYYTAKEKVVYKDMAALYKSVVAYRDDYFAKTTNN